MIKYPNGIKIEQTKQETKPKKTIINAANRGMSFEKDINLTNEYYKNKEIALITKRPTPINVVKVDYSKGSLITNAYFEKQSTTDYNGIYKGRYIDFEAKSVQNATSFPLSNITNHQFKHLESVINHGGLAFFIIQFRTLNKVYLLSAQKILDFKNNETRKSIPLSFFKEHAYEIEEGYIPRYDYIKIIDKYFL